MSTGDNFDHSGLGDISRKGEDVSRYYDNWAGDYDKTLAEWRYEAPERTASILSASLLPASVILDAGCGTGLCGRALIDAGFKTIDGIDISPRSLQIAGASGIYRTVREVDMQQLPLPIADSRYDGLVCVGVFTYLPDSMGTIREFSRIVKPGGIIVFTQRSDVFVERDFPSVLNRLTDEGTVMRIQVSDPQPYLPENEEFADRILVHYVSCLVP